MNMAISSTPVTSGKTVTATSGSVTSSTLGGGFAGALVQAIDGSSNTATTNSGLTLPNGLSGLLGQLGLDTSVEQSQDLLAMLANLVDQLQQLEESDTALSSESMDELAALLAAFQGVLQQVNLNSSIGNSEEAVTTELVKTATPVLDPTVAKPVVKALRETLQQLSTALSSGKDGAQLVANFIGQLKAQLDAIGSQATNTGLTNQAVPASVSETSSQSATTKASDNGVAVSKEAMTQTAAAVVVQETRRPIQALREPIWRFNVVNSNEAAATNNSQTAVVPSIVTTEEASQSDSQPAWTFMQNDSLANTESVNGKATIPTQVPVQQFAEQMSKFLIKQFQLTQGNGTSEAKLTLTPEHLGQVDIRIVMHNGQLTAQFMTDNLMARDLLENQMSQLRSALSSQGLQVERLEVVQQPAANASTTFMHQEQRQSNSGNGTGSNGNSNGDSYEDPAVFAAELERNSSLKEFGYGSSINVTA
ncbi:flagellar hook-length control protein FliK [Cohnella sp. WQ 127256]|uniref:flagellar hook-length control protein FliK n=1 Tax=Cohnella sp. WQ 127256 TaxID=2938790 RepID=UPI0021177052|nr:flagellar hook-length control protein FliK [Cohnella sp. WQ 127256]